MKVAHLISGGETGGSRKHVITLLEKLKKEQICLILLQDGDFAQEARAAGIWVEVFAQKNRYDLRVLKRVATFLKEQSFSILHTHGPRSNLFGIVLKTIVGMEWVTTVHSDPQLDFIRGGLRGTIFTKLSKFALRKMDHYFAVTEAFRQKMIALGISSNKITTIYNGIDYSEPLSREVTLRTSLGYSDQDFVMVIVARLHPIKGHHELFAAMAGLQAYKHIKLLVVGDGPSREVLIDQVNRLGISDRVQLVGFRKDIRALFSISDVGLLTSYSESFPLVMLECANEGRTMIGTDVGGVKELVADPSLGWVVPPKDVEALRNAILQAYAKFQADQLIVMGENLRERASSLFALDKLAEDTLRTYEAIITHTVN